MEGKIAAKYILRATLKSVSPFLISSGGNDMADKDVILLPNGKPYIPASSFAGVLRNEFKSYFSKAFGVIWGDSDNNYQSHIIIDDLIANGDGNLSIRDGVKINENTGIAQTGSKYDYQIVEPGLSFNLNIEATMREGFDMDEFERALLILKDIIKVSNYRVGAHTGFGFGKLNSEQVKIYEFKFPKSFDAWLDYINGEKLDDSSLFDDKTIEVNEFTCNQFKIKADFKVKTSLLTATYAANPELPDKSQLKSNDKYVLSGKSIKGAIRHRALKILTTKMPVDIAEGKLKNMMGWVNPHASNEQAIKSRLRIEESVIQNAVKGQVQPRIKTNRFEGSIMNNLLFSSEAVWRNGDETLQIELTLDKMKNDEVALLLQILKDLWTGDLPIGGEKNIGRGVLIGKRAEISWNGKTVIFEASNDNKLNFLEGTAEDLNILINTKN